MCLNCVRIWREAGLPLRNFLSFAHCEEIYVGARNHPEAVVPTAWRSSASMDATTGLLNVRRASAGTFSSLRHSLGRPKLQTGRLIARNCTFHGMRSCSALRRPLIQPQATQFDSVGGTEFSLCPLGEALQDWILENDGHIHPALHVVQNAPCGGGRGVITTEDISAEDAANMPLILVPDALYLTSQVQLNCLYLYPMRPMSIAPIPLCQYRCLSH